MHPVPCSPSTEPDPSYQLRVMVLGSGLAMGLQPSHYAVGVGIPMGMVMILLLLDGSLRLTALVLSICLLLTGGAVYVFLDQQAKQQEAEKLDSVSLNDIFRDLKQSIHNESECAIALNMIQRKLASNNKPLNCSRSLEVEFVVLGVPDQLLLIARSCQDISDSRILKCLEILNTLLVETKARDTLFDTRVHLQDFVDSFIQLTEQFHETICAQGEMLPFSKLYVSICVGFTLMAINCPMAQTRIGDKGGLSFVHNLLLSKELFGKANLVRWFMSCVMTLTSDCPPNKNEFFRNGGMQTVLKTMLEYPNNLEILRYALKSLHNLIATDSQALYSVSKAREICFQLKFTDEILSIQKRFPDDGPMVAICGQILQSIAQTFS